MATIEHVACDEMATTEQRLRQVTTAYVVVLCRDGHEAGSIRRCVMQVARKVIESLAADEYEIETHTAIVQRTIDAVLRKMGVVENTPVG
jgi:hypothetical protein